MRAGRLRHDGNPVLEWCVGNVVGRYDARGNVYPKKRLLSRLLLADRDSQCGAEPALLFAVLAERFEAAAPSQIAVEILCCDTMERAQPFLQAAMVGIDVVDMQVGRFRSRTTRLWQNTTGDRLPAGEADDRLAAVAAELVVDTHHAF